ncbi:TPA: hypothetical protein ACXND4_004867, partial [Burkholderia multivorans]
MHGVLLHVCRHAIAVFLVQSCGRRRSHLVRSRDRSDRRFGLESVERRLPRAVAFGAVAAFRRWCTRACIVVATRRTRSRHIVVRREHRIAKQVERA